MEDRSQTNCVTGACPKPVEDKEVVRLSEGSGGKEMHSLIGFVRKAIGKEGEWKNSDEDSATLKFNDTNIVFTTDSYIVTPIFFPKGNIGKIAFCGTVNDLAVMGAEPLGLSLALVLEEGFSKEKLSEILKTIGDLSREYKVPIVTGDTKVMERKAIDGIIINTSGVGQTKDILDKEIEEGDSIIVSAPIGDHGAALLAKRFELESSIVSDCKPLIEEMRAISKSIKCAKDITRGGLASVLNELASKHNVCLELIEKDIPVRREVESLTQILGIDYLQLACEGTLVCFCSKENESIVLEQLRKFNPHASKIGSVVKGKGVNVQTKFGKKLLSMPSGNIVPRIC